MGAHCKCRVGGGPPRGRNILRQSGRGRTECGRDDVGHEIVHPSGLWVGEAIEVQEGRCLPVGSKCLAIGARMDGHQLGNQQESGGCVFLKTTHRVHNGKPCAWWN